MTDSKESRSERVCANGFCLPESQVVRLRDNYRLSNIFRSMRLSRLYAFGFSFDFFFQWLTIPVCFISGVFSTGSVIGPLVRSIKLAKSSPARLTWRSPM